MIMPRIKLSKYSWNTVYSLSSNVECIFSSLSIHICADKLEFQCLLKFQFLFTPTQRALTCKMIEKNTREHLCRSSYEHYCWDIPVYIRLHLNYIIGGRLHMFLQHILPPWCSYFTSISFLILIYYNAPLLFCPPSRH